MKLDVGCGGLKRSGYVGLDRHPSEGVDLICDISRERWPVEDRSVSHLFSSHCLEHLDNLCLPHVFKEISRVCDDGARVEIWNPYAFHRDQHLVGHVTSLTEEIYYHSVLRAPAHMGAGAGR